MFKFATQPKLCHPGHQHVWGVVQSPLAGVHPAVLLILVDDGLVPEQSPVEVGLGPVGPQVERLRHEHHRGPVTGLGRLLHVHHAAVLVEALGEGLDVVDGDLGKDVVAEAAIHPGQGDDGSHDAAVGGRVEVEQRGLLVVASVVREPAHLVVFCQCQMDLTQDRIIMNHGPVDFSLQVGRPRLLLEHILERPQLVFVGFGELGGVAAAVILNAAPAIATPFGGAVPDLIKIFVGINVENIVVIAELIRSRRHVRGRPAQG